MTDEKNTASSGQGWTSETEAERKERIRAERIERMNVARAAAREKRLAALEEARKQAEAEGHPLSPRTKPVKMITLGEGDQAVTYPEETPKAAQAFHEFYLLGPGRTLKRLQNLFLIAKQRVAHPEPPDPDGPLPTLGQLSPDALKAMIPTTNLDTLKGWAEKYKWKDRCVLLDEEARLTSVANWQNRLQELREADWIIGSRMRDIAEKMLDEAPKFIKSRRQFIPGKAGNPDREIITIALREDMIVRLAEAATMFQRFAVMAGTEQVQRLDITTNGEPVNTIKVQAFDYNAAIANLAPLGPDGKPLPPPNLPTIRVIEAPKDPLSEDSDADADPDSNTSSAA